MIARRTNLKRLNTLTTYGDWLHKSKYEFHQYTLTSNIYDMANCFLSLNALPEWIKGSDEASEQLKILAAEKLRFMKNINDCCILDEHRLHELDQKLRLIRLFCNHSKHGEKKQGFEIINMGAVLPATFPIRFEHMSVGATSIYVPGLLSAVLEFWESAIGC